MNKREIQHNIADMQPDPKQGVRIQTFGSVKIENAFGCYEENLNPRGNPGFLLKYLLVNHHRRVSAAELMETFWPDVPESARALRICLSRLRTALSPLQFTGRNGLIATSSGSYALNPNHIIQIDAVRFIQITEQLRNIDLSDPNGLTLCAEALELYHGHFLVHTDELPWLAEQRKRYYDEFYFLANSALDRAQALNDASVLPILYQRVTAFIAETDAIHSRLNRLLAKHKPALFQEEADAASFFSEHDVHIRLFGPMEVENKYGRVEENTVRASHSWLLLKYLLINRGMDISQTHLMELFWPDELTNESGDSAFRARLSRLRQALQPLHLDGRSGLVLFSDGYYSVNPDYTIHADRELLSNLMTNIDNTACDDPDGLELCSTALKLFRGRFLESTAPHPWVDQLQAHYHQMFCRLAESTLARAKNLKDTSILPLLCRRMLDVAPQEAVLNIEIISFMVENRMLHELVQFVSKLSRYDGEGFEWLEPNALPPEEPFEFQAENEIRVRLFGPIELENQSGRVSEQKTTYRWLILKYLLVNPGRLITKEEFFQNVWQYEANADNDVALAFLYSHLRRALFPLKLDKHGLVFFYSDCSALNPKYHLITDADILNAKMEQIQSTAPEDPAGLQLCLDVVSLFRAPFMEYTKETGWLTEWRNHYGQMFSDLVQTTLERMQAVGTNQGISLLWQRAVAYAPENKDLHMNILTYMVEQNLPTELIAYICRLARSTGGDRWIDDL